MKDCVFCRIAAHEIPARIVYEDGFAVAFRDIAPAAPVHVLVVPKAHVGGVLEAGGVPGIMDRLTAAAAAAARAEGIDGSGFRLVVNTGAHAGQTVGHLHVHVLGGRDLGPMALPGAGREAGIAGSNRD